MIRKAKQLIFTGDMIGADEAHRIGLVDEVCPPEELMDTAMKMAGKIAAKGPIAMRAAKGLINRGLDVNLSAGCDMEKMTFGTILATKDSKEGLNAFSEKRKPEFKGE